MEAKDIFKKLGYKIITDGEDVLVYRKELALGGEQGLIFHKKSDGMYFENSLNIDGIDFLSYKELQAINQQMKEIGKGK